MKRTILILFALGTIITGCTKDNIAQADDIIAEEEDESTDVYQAEDFDHTVRIVFAEGSATVEGTNDSIKASLSGAGVTITNSGRARIAYHLSGATSNGYLKIYSARRQALLLEGVSIANPGGAAINVQGPTAAPNKGKRTLVVLEGDNRLSDGTTYGSTPSGEDEKAALFSEGQLVFSGSGSLTVTATGKAGITSDDYVRFMSGPTVSVRSSAGHGVRGKDYVTVSGGTLDISVSANMKKGISSDGHVTIEGGTTTISITGSAAYDSEDSEYTGSAGIKADSNFYMLGGVLSVSNSGTGGKGISGDGTATFSGGTVTVSCTGNNYGNSGGWGGSSSNSVSAKGIKFDGDISFCGSTVSASAKSHEAIESKRTLTVTSGVVYGYSAGDDGINSTGDMTIEGGYVCGYTAGTKTGADGMDANGNMYIKGGVVYAICTHGSPDVALDANTEGGKKLYIQGGTLVAVGGLENGAQMSQTCYRASSLSRNTWYAMTVGNETHCFKTPSGGNSLIVSGSSQPSLFSGVTASGGTSHFDGILLAGATYSGGSTVSLTTYSGGGGHWWK